jgi:N-acetylmuramoyl-L-alanine amidase
MQRFRSLLILCALLVVAGPLHARRTIVIDAGHGGHDRGGIAGQRYSEKAAALDVSRRLNSRLRAAGFRTIMTRDRDVFVGLRQRCNIANRQSNAAFISVHFNSGRREGANGIETYYYTSHSASFAAAVHAEVLRAAGTENRFVRRRGFFVIRNTRHPAVLAELGFLTNRAEGARINGSASHRQRLADALARAIIRMYR